MTRRLILAAALLLLSACSAGGGGVRSSEAIAVPASAPNRTRLAAEFETPTTSTRPAPPARASRDGRRPRPPVPSSPPVVGGSPANQGDWRALVASLPWDSATAFAIVRCESGGNPNARNPRSSATGLFQILRGPIDAIENVRLAFRMWQSRGWQPWNASRRCWA